MFRPASGVIRSTWMAFGAHYKPYGAFTKDAAPHGVDHFSHAP